METLESSIGFAGRDAGVGLGLIEALLDDQRDLTAVERFSQHHEDAARPLQGQFYSALLPGKAPGPGQQYAFEVDLDRCSGCKACVAACHSLNGLDDGEAWREVGLIIGGDSALPVLQHVTSACHHCLDPACLNACPVNAYEKDPITGIVKHLDDQCFGCQYCTLACPYDAPKFHPGKGIVRKCDMCSDRLKVGEAPACVQGCPTEAIRIRVVDRAEVVAAAESNGFLPASPAPDYTLPTTRYTTKRPLQSPVRAADHHVNVPEHAHAPLVVMLVLTQAAVGGFLADAVARWAGLPVSPLLVTISLVCGLIGINASLLHLGRPLLAYRALIGLKHSWLSREIGAFGLFAAAANVHVGAVWLRPEYARATALAVSVVGLLAVLCSIMVYHVVRRAFWRFASSAPKFLGTTVVMGLALWAMTGYRTAALWLMAATCVRLGLDSLVLFHLSDERLTPARRTALLLCGPLASEAVARVVLGVVGGMVLPAIAILLGSTVPHWTLNTLAVGSCLALIAGEFLERTLFFQAVVRLKMPGGLSA